jgi:aspartyl protease family protein
MRSMTKEGGPWERPARPPRRGGIRFAVWIALLLAGALALWQLAVLFPNSMASEADRARLVYYVGFLAILASSIVFSRRYRFAEVIRAIALWTVVTAVLIVGYTYQSDLADIAVRVRSSLIPSYGVAVNADEFVLSESEGGNFTVYGSVNGAPIRFLIDTGASEIVLSPADAQRAGIDVQNLDYSRTYETANGIGHGATVTVASLAVGPVHFNDVPVAIDRTPMSSSLLGMAFLKRLKSFEFRNRQLYLRWR